MKWSLVLVFAGAAFAQDQTFSLQGTVADSVTRLPVRKARVSLTPQFPMAPRRLSPAPSGAAGGAGTISMEPPQMPTTTTDAGGNFAFSGLAPGHYGVNVQHSSYPSRLGMRPQTTTVQITAGTEPARLSLELVPGATITGRIVDEDGDPIPNCYVQTTPPPSRGPYMYGGSLGSDPSNDEGVYRVYGITPGKALVVASCGRPVFQPRPLSPTTSPPPPPTLSYVPQYYPGVADPSAAQTIELAAGAVREGIDFRFAPVRVYTVKGTVRVLPGASRPERSSNYLMLIRRDLSDNPFARNVGQRGGTIDWSKGTFEIPAVPPGSYAITSFDMPVRADVEVIDRTVEATVDIRALLDVKGSVVVDGETKTPMSRFMLQFIPSDRAAFPGPGNNAQMKDDGSFTASGLMPGRYTVRVFQPMGAYVKSVSMGGQNDRNGNLDLSSGASDVRLVLGTNSATIAGTAPPGRMIQIVSASPSEMFMGARGTAADAKGAFKIEMIAPGKYRVMVDGAADDAQEVTLSEGETLTLDLKASTPQQ